METTAKGEVDQRLETTTAIIVSYAAKRFGHVESRSGKSKYTLNPRAHPY